MRSQAAWRTAAAVAAAAFLLGLALGACRALPAGGWGGGTPRAYAQAADLAAHPGALVAYYYHPATGCLVPLTFEPSPGKARYWPAAAAAVGGPPPEAAADLGTLLPGPGAGGSPAPRLERVWVEAATLNLLLDRLPWADLDPGAAEGVRTALTLTLSRLPGVSELAVWHGGGPAALPQVERVPLRPPPLVYLALQGRSRAFLACLAAPDLPAPADPARAVEELRQAAAGLGRAAAPLRLPVLGRAARAGDALRLEFERPWYAWGRRSLELAGPVADGLALTLGGLCGAGRVEWVWEGAGGGDQGGGGSPAAAAGGQAGGGTALAARASGRACALGPNPSELPASLSGAPALEMAAVGDVMLGRGIAGRMARRGQTYAFDEVRSYLTGAGLAVGNLEAALSDRGQPIPDKGIWLLARPDTAPVLAGSGLDVLALANNHILDYDSPALLQNLDILRQSGLLGVGAGEDRDAAWEPRVVEAGGLRLGFLAASEFADIYWTLKYPRSFAAGPGLPGVASLDAAGLEAAVSQLAAGCDVVAVYLHWGVEESPTPTPEQRALAALLCGAGADIILGDHPHVPQGLELIGTSVVAYSLGNFVYDQHKDPNSRSMIAFFRLGKDGVDQVRILPVRLVEGQPQPAGGADAGLILGALVDRSARLGTALRWGEGRGTLVLEPARR